MRDEKEERKKQARSNKQTNKAKQHSTPKAVTFPRKNELPQVGLEPTTLYTPDMYMNICSAENNHPCGTKKYATACTGIQVYEEIKGKGV